MTERASRLRALRRRGWRRLTALAALVCAMTGSLASAASLGGNVPLRPIQDGRTVLASVDRQPYPKISAAVRSADGSSLAAWDFSRTTPSWGTVEAERFDSSGPPAGSRFRLDTPAPPIPGYHYRGGSGPDVAYSPSSDSWIVVFGGNYAQNGHCTIDRRDRRLVGQCGYLEPVMSVRVGSAGQLLSAPSILTEEPYAVGGSTVTCRISGCMLVWAMCTDMARTDNASTRIRPSRLRCR